MIHRREYPPDLEWDEYGQGYRPGTGTLIVCICGEVRENGDWSGHYCPADGPPGWDGAPEAEA